MRPVFAVPITLGLKEMPCMEPALQGMGVLKIGSQVGVGAGVRSGASWSLPPSVFLQTLLLPAPGRALRWRLGRRGDAIRLLPAIITPAALQFRGRLFHSAWSEASFNRLESAWGCLLLLQEQPSDSAGACVPGELDPLVNT